MSSIFLDSTKGTDFVMSWQIEKLNLKWSFGHWNFEHFPSLYGLLRARGFKLFAFDIIKSVMDLGVSNEWCTHYKVLSKIVKIEPNKDWVVHFSQNRVVHLHHSGAPKSITALKLDEKMKRNIPRCFHSSFQYFWSCSSSWEIKKNIKIINKNVKIEM